MMKRVLLVVFAVSCGLAPLGAASKLKIAPKDLKGSVVEDLSAPFQVRAVVLNQAITLSWEWHAPDPGPVFENFGYEVFRDSAVIAIVGTTSYSDFNLQPGSYTYQVRAKGGSREMGKQMAHMSAWSEPAEGTIQSACLGAPTIQLTVEPTQKVYGSIPALRLHFKGQVTAPKGCKVSKAMFHIDSGLSSERSGPLFLDPKGNFDEYIDAMDASDEHITGNATFKAFVTAKDEVGDAASPVFNIDMDRRNPFAPK